MFTPKVIGVGGIFFKAKKPSRLREWYRKHLSFNLNPYGSSFEFRNTKNTNLYNLREKSMGFPHFTSLM